MMQGTFNKRKALFEKNRPDENKANPLYPLFLGVGDDKRNDLHGFTVKDMGHYG